MKFKNSTLWTIMSRGWEGKPQIGKKICKNYIGKRTIYYSQYGKKLKFSNKKTTQLRMCTRPIYAASK